MYEPTIAEVIFWIVVMTPIFLGGLLTLLGFNWHFDPKADDPYRYCPKEEE